MNIDQRNRIRALLELVDRKQLVRDAFNGAMTSLAYVGRSVLPRGKGNRWIAERLRSGQPAAVGKIGASERRALSAWRRKTPYTSFNFEEMHVAGVFPPDRATLDRFASEFSAGCASMDLLAAWGGRQERRFLDEFCPDTTLCRRTDLDEPYYFSDPWSTELAGKRVLVVSPFVDSITRQYARRGAVWPGSRVLPSFDLMTLAMPHSDALVPSRYGSWFEMCDDLVQRALNMEFDAALIGAGAASLILCLSFKKAGKFAIHLGGATQILFGITGKRWDTDPTISKLQTQSWIRPSPAETPTKSYKVERGAYW